MVVMVIKVVISAVTMAHITAVLPPGVHVPNNYEVYEVECTVFNSCNYNLP